MSFINKGQTLNIPCQDQNCSGELVVDLDKAQTVKSLNIKCNKCGHFMTVNTENIINDLYEQSKKALGQYFNVK